MRIVPAVLISIVMAGCATRSAEPPALSAPDFSLAVVAPPEEIGSHRLTETISYPQESLGTLYRYKDETVLSPDIFVYPLREGVAEEDSGRREQVRAESLLFEEVLDFMVQQRRYEAYEIIRDAEFAEAQNTPTPFGWHVHAVLLVDGKELDSHQHIFLVGEKLVKVRTTYPRGELEPAEVDAFLVAFFRAAIVER